MKNFTADYIDENGEKSNRTYSMYVRDYEMNPNTDLDPLEKYLIDKKIVTVTEIATSRILSVPFYESYDIIKEDILKNNAKKIASFDGQQ